MTGQPWTPPPLPMVTLRASIALDGTAIEQTEAVPYDHWLNGGDDFQGFVKRNLRERLARSIVEHLDPEVTVELPQPSVSDVMCGILHHMDRPSEW